MQIFNINYVVSLVMRLIILGLRVNFEDRVLHNEMNGTKYDVSLYYSLTESRMRAFD